jgi:uncharacterized membrane protein YeaQ/YmgE (transglycosylase-associated protein family)
LLNLVAWVVVGLIVVAVGYQLVSKDQPLGALPTIALAVLGAGVGIVSAQFVDLGAVRSVTNIDWISVVITVFVGVLVSLLVGLLRR